MYCISCGKNNLDHAKYCLYCGSEIPGADNKQHSETIQSPETAAPIRVGQDPVQRRQQTESPNAPQLVHVNVASSDANNADAVNLTLVAMSKKSAGLAFVLTLFFGPLGLLYASIGGGLAMTFFVPILAGLLAVFANLDFSSFIGALIAYVLFSNFICIVWGQLAVNSHNNELLATLRNKSQPPTPIGVELPSQTSKYARHSPDGKPKAQSATLPSSQPADESSIAMVDTKTPSYTEVAIGKTDMQPEESGAKIFGVVLVCIFLVVLVAAIIVSATSTVFSKPSASAIAKASEPSRASIPKQDLNASSHPPTEKSHDEKKRNELVDTAIHVSGLVPYKSLRQEVLIKMYPYTEKGSAMIKGYLSIGQFRLPCAATFDGDYLQMLICTFGYSEMLVKEGMQTLESAEEVSVGLIQHFSKEYGQPKPEEKGSGWIDKHLHMLIVGTENGAGFLMFAGSANSKK